MQLHAGHSDGSQTVHLTHTTLVVEALCGEVVAYHGEPDVAVLCGECLAFANEHGHDVTAWIAMTEPVAAALPLAA